MFEIDSASSSTLTHETELSSEMKDSAQILLDAYVRSQGLNISQMLRKSVETRDFINCLEPRNVRAVMKRVVEELTSIEGTLEGLFESGGKFIIKCCELKLYKGFIILVRTSASSDSSRKTHFSLTALSSKQQHRTTWSNYTTLDNTFVSNIHRLFSERVDIFSSTIEFSKHSIMSGIIRISLKVISSLFYQ